MIRKLRLYLLKLDVERKCRKRRLAAQARSEASQRGVSTYWQRSGTRTRQLFGGGL